MHLLEPRIDEPRFLDDRLSTLKDPHVRLQVIEAVDLPLPANKDRLDQASSNPYVRVSLLPDASNAKETAVKKKTQDPIFEETFAFQVGVTVATVAIATVAMATIRLLFILLFTIYHFSLLSSSSQLKICPFFLFCCGFSARSFRKLFFRGEGGILHLTPPFQVSLLLVLVQNTSSVGSTTYFDPQSFFFLDIYKIFPFANI